MKPQRPDIRRASAIQDHPLLSSLPEELHDIRRVRDYGQEDDLKEALGKMIGRVEELVSNRRPLILVAADIHTRVECSTWTGPEDTGGA